jgi:peptidoglycan/xylan/chitin deacetylase (PgdA/CDA1 family)
MFCRKQDYCVLALYCLGYSRIRNLIFRYHRIPLTRFLAFHDVPTETLASFESKLRFLKRRANVVTLDDFLTGRLAVNRINVVITFDDGYKSWVTHAIPLLQRYGLPATFFVSSGFVGLSKNDQAAFLRAKLCAKQVPSTVTGGLSCADLRSIVDKGFTVGGHTVNHCNLATSQMPDILRNEIEMDKKNLEMMTGRRVSFFCYPSGAYQNDKADIPALLRNAGYRGAVTTVAGFNFPGESPYMLHRELTDATMSTAVFKARVYGNSDGARSMSNLKRLLSGLCVNKHR